jgi:hypothetical protein
MMLDSAHSGSLSILFLGRQMQRKYTIAALVLFLAANVYVFVMWKADRADVAFGLWKPLGELPEQERAAAIRSCFPVDDFEIVALPNQDRTVQLPMPSQWNEQLVVETIYKNIVDEGGDDVDEGDEGKSSDDDSRLPWKAGVVDVSVQMIGLTAYSIGRSDDDKSLLAKERLVSQDASFTKNGIAVPLFAMIVAGRYYTPDSLDSITSFQRSAIINGYSTPDYESAVPIWMIPQKPLSVGDKWEIRGANPSGSNANLTPPVSAGTIKRFVLFEGREAAEVVSQSTSNDFEAGRDSPPRTLKEDRVCYIDLATGVPLWHESTISGDDEYQGLVRGCNQVFVDHLVSAGK